MDRFAAEGGERHQNRDGWGIMFAEGRDAHLFREAAPASDSLLDRFVREHEDPSPNVIAHVRRASRGKVSLANTHPFRRVRAGRAHHFAHNGTLKNLKSITEASTLSADCIGDTDSELAFLVLLERFAKTAPDVADMNSRFAVFTEFARCMARLGTANILFFDSHALYVHADQRVWETESGLIGPQPPGLHMMQAEPGAIGFHHSCVAGEFACLSARLVMFASVPLSDQGWTPMPRGVSMLVHAGEIVARTDAATDDIS